MTGAAAGQTAGAAGAAAIVAGGSLFGSGTSPGVGCFARYARMIPQFPLANPVASELELYR